MCTTNIVIDFFVSHLLQALYLFPIKKKMHCETFDSFSAQPETFTRHLLKTGGTGCHNGELHCTYTKNKTIVRKETSYTQRLKLKKIKIFVYSFF